MTTAAADVAEEDANIAVGVACEGASKDQRIQKVVAPSTKTMVIPTGNNNLPGKLYEGYGQWHTPLPTSHSNMRPTRRWTRLTHLSYKHHALQQVV